MKERLFFLGLLAGVAYGLYRFATWEAATPLEDFMRNLCIPDVFLGLAASILLRQLRPQK